MRTKISNLPITLNRKATMYEGVGDGDTTCFDLEYGDNVILTCDGSNVEYWNGVFTDSRMPPFSELQIELSMTPEEFIEWTFGDDTYVDLILIDNTHVGVFITTKHDVIYDEVHSIR